jgi:hypothetical protein
MFRRNRVKKLPYYRWAIGYIQLLYIKHRLEREIAQHRSFRLTRKEQEYLVQIQVEIAKVNESIDELQALPKRSMNLIDRFVIQLYTWASGLPPGTVSQTTVQDLS